jgi:hypothetical protein
MKGPDANDLDRKQGPDAVRNHLDATVRARKVRVDAANARARKLIIEAAPADRRSAWFAARAELEPLVDAGDMLLDEANKVLQQAWADAHDSLRSKDGVAGRAAGAAGGNGPKPAARAKATWRDHAIKAQDLCDLNFPEVRFIVPGMFPEGVTLLASRPKLGKSWLLLQIGSAVALGNPILVTNDKPVCGDVLYLPLEDGKKRLRRRLMKYFGPNRETWPPRLTIVDHWRRLDEGGLDDIRAWCKSVERPTVIMIDTLKRVRPPKKKEQSDYAADYEACQGLIAAAHEFPGLMFLVAHHDRKMDADDVFDTVSGTLGLTGGVDTIAILKRSGLDVTLYIEGRDLEENVEKAVRFDRETCRWTILGEACEVQRTGERGRIMSALADAKSDGLKPVDVADLAGLSRTNARQLLFRMARDGEIGKVGYGRYFHPSHTPVTAVTPVTPAKKQRKTKGLTSDSDSVTGVTENGDVTRNANLTVEQQAAVERALAGQKVAGGDGLDH